MSTPHVLRVCAAMLLLTLALAACDDGQDDADEPAAGDGAEPDDAAAGDTDEADADATDEDDADATDEDDAEADDDPPSSNPDGCVEEVADDGVFVDEVRFEHAQTVDVTYFDTHKMVEIDEPATDETHRFALVQCGVDAPELDHDVPTVEVPIDSAISLTTTNLPHFEEMDAVDRLVGVGEPDFVATPSVVEAIEAGEIEGYGTAEGAPELERVIEAAPDVVVLDAFGEESLDEVDRLEDAGISALLNTDFDEATLLGRAEWLKVTALLLNEEAAANDAFDEIEAGYNEVRDAVADVTDRPRVLADEPFEGTWFAAGGESFLASGIADAGGDYVFADDESAGSLEFDIETVLDQGADADVWIQAGSVEGTLDDLLASDERFAEIRAFEDSEVWAADAQTGPGGGSARFETAYLAADDFLADLAVIFHPDAIEHEPIFFGRVGEQP